MRDSPKLTPGVQADVHVVEHGRPPDDNSPNPVPRLSLDAGRPFGAVGALPRPPEKAGLVDTQSRWAGEPEDNPQSACHATVGLADTTATLGTDPSHTDSTSARRPPPPSTTAWGAKCRLPIATSPAKPNPLAAPLAIAAWEALHNTLRALPDVQAMAGVAARGHLPDDSSPIPQPRPSLEAGRPLVAYRVLPRPPEMSGCNGTR